MPREINPQDTPRATAYKLWLKAPNPMVTFFKTLDVTNLVRISRKRNLKFNMLLDFCIGKAAYQVKEFYLLPVGEKLMQYDTPDITVTFCPIYTSFPTTVSPFTGSSLVAGFISYAI